LKKSGAAVETLKVDAVEDHVPDAHTSNDAGTGVGTATVMARFHRDHARDAHA
jgi:hypothetical protein